MDHSKRDEIVSVHSPKDVFVTAGDIRAGQTLWINGEDAVRAHLQWSPERVDAVVLTNGHLRFRAKENAPGLPRGSLVYHKELWKMSRDLPGLTHVGNTVLGNKTVPLMAVPESVCY